MTTHQAVAALRKMEAVPHRGEHLSVRVVDGEGIIYNPNTKRLHTLNATGLLVWDMCDASRDVRAIAQGVSETFGIEERVAQEDVAGYLAELHDEGLVTYVA